MESREENITINVVLKYMSSSTGNDEYLFDRTNSGDETDFIYGIRPEGYDAFDFKGALEADVDIVIDLENREGLYRPRMEDSELADTLKQIHSYAEEQGLDTYNICFREQDPVSWRSVITDLWSDMEAEEQAGSEAGEEEIGHLIESDEESSEPVAGHSMPGQAYTAPIGTDTAQDEHRFDASEGWGWS